jgi:hypothetical protein
MFIDNIISGKLIIDKFFYVTNASPNDENTTSCEARVVFSKEWGWHELTFVKKLSILKRTTNYI